MKIAIYTITSPLHDEKAVCATTATFLDSLHIDYALSEGSFDSYGQHDLDLIYVCTGGTENVFKAALPQLRKQSDRPFYLLTSGKSNSLAASLEILSFLRQQGLPGEVLHGSAEYVASRIGLLAKVGEAHRSLDNCRLGIIGKPSDWLISSGYDVAAVRRRLGVELVEIPMQELKDALPETNDVHEGLRKLLGQYQLQGFTLRCFDLLTALHNTGCLALAQLGAEGFVAGCEGDVPAMLSMIVVKTLTGHQGFQANPARIDCETGEILFAHCTIPLNMVERYELDTHFESGIGVGVRGFVKAGPVTILKVSGDLSRWFVEEGMLLECQAKPDLCRTQLLVRLTDASRASYFLTNPIGNHHIVVLGHHKRLLEEFLALTVCR